MMVQVFVFAATAADAPKLTFKFTTIDVPGSHGTNIAGISNPGAMVGWWYTDQNGDSHGFRLLRGRVTNIDDPKGTNTLCFAINKHGVIVGWYTN
jgi:hypothetical protein